MTETPTPNPADAGGDRPKEIIPIAAGYTFERPVVEGQNFLPFFLCLNGKKVVVTWPLGNQSRLFASEDCPELRAFAAALSAGSQTKAGESENTVQEPAFPRRVRLPYTNWRGEHAEREIAPTRLFWGSNQWHPEPQWLIEAWDVAKSEIRTFALAGFGTRPAATAVESDAVGWLFLNPDTGVELSDNHPVESGEVPDAEDIRPANAEALKEELIASWKHVADMERAAHRPAPVAAPASCDEKPYAFCCNGDPKHCDCVNPSHGTALFERRNQTATQQAGHLATQATQPATAGDDAGGEDSLRGGGEYWRSIDSAPEDEHVILATTGDFVGEALMLIDEDSGRQKWTWALGPVHPHHQPLGWRPMPTPIRMPALSDNRPGGFDGPTGAD